MKTNSRNKLNSNKRKSEREQEMRKGAREKDVFEKKMKKKQDIKGPKKLIS